jgi:16S rRNA (guanine527-N7)-methyltransferase
MDKNEFLDLLNKAFFENGLTHLLNDCLSEQLFSLTSLLINENKKYNLTAITTPEGIIYKHYADSLRIAELIPAGSSVIDVGCGAGFPSLPLAAARPDISVTSLDSNSKKIGFIELCKNELSLTNLRTVCARAEEAAHTTLRGSFNIAVARAVSSFPVLSELCIPYLLPGGKFFAMKGPDGVSEFNASRNFLTVLGACKPEILTYELRIASEHEDRTLISIEKLGKTPDNFPRNYSQITKKPLA